MGWIRPKLDINTHYLDFPQGEKRCAYCGKVIKPDTEWDDYDSWEYYHCDCEDAQKEIKITLALRELEADYGKKKRELKESMPEPKFKAEFKTVLTEINNK